MKKDATTPAAAEPKTHVKVTRKMVLIWSVSVSMLLILIVGFTALGLGLTQVRYARDINFDDVMYVRYMNSLQDKELSAKDLAAHRNPMNTILNAVNAAHRTNQLKKLFVNTDEHVTYESSSTSKVVNDNINNCLQIRFTTPKFSVIDTTVRNRFKLVSADAPDANTQRLVHMILIPLNNTGNNFQEQSWYFVTQDPNRYSQNQSITISYRFVTYGNYHELGTTVKDLSVGC